MQNYAYRDCGFAFFACILPHSDHINCSACRYKFPRSILLPTYGTQLFIFIVAALAASVHGQVNRVADADPKYIATQEGQDINLMCRIAQPVASCRFSIPGELNEIKLNPRWARNDNFAYFGEGLDKGQCGISIRNVKESYHGNATCRLDPDDGQADAIAQIEIVIAKAPHPTELHIPDSDRLEAGNEIEAECSSIDGRPAANLTWYLNDQPLGNGRIEVIDSQDDNTVYYSVRSTLRYRLRPEDLNKNLICRAYHPGFPDGFNDARNQLQINFRPVPKAEILVSGLEIGTSANVGPVTIQANPRPSVKWTVDGTVINQGDQNERFVASEPVQVDMGVWNVSLTVIGFTLQDTTRKYQLRANNAFGTTDYVIRIGEAQDVTGEISLGTENTIRG